MPELDNLYPGDGLNLASYPHLRQIVQTGHSNIRGVIKFKDSLVYANTSLSGFTLPQNHSHSTLFECYENGREVASHSNGDIADKANELWMRHFSQTAGDITDDHLFNVEVTGG